jgi:hypothetical protein
MPRPYKKGLDYFELDCYLDDKFGMIEAEFGDKGFAIAVKLYQLIYRELGYYCEWSDELIPLHKSKMGLSSGIGTIKEVVQACIRVGIFSQELFDKYHILTSRGIQERYLRAVAKRKGIEVKKEYSLVKVTQNAVNDGRNPVNDVNNPVNDAKKRKEKKRINNSAPAPAPPDPPEDDDEWEDPEESLRKWEAWKAQREKNDES